MERSRNWKFSKCHRPGPNRVNVKSLRGRHVFLKTKIIWIVPGIGNFPSVLYMRTCPKCGRDFSQDVFWTTSLKRHLARKNPCVKNVAVKTVGALDEIDVSVCLPVPTNIPNEEVAPWIFRRVFSVPGNVFFVKPNLKHQDILIKETRGAILKSVTRDELLRLFFKNVVCKLGLSYSSFDSWLDCSSRIDVATGEYDPFEGCPFYTCMYPVVDDFTNFYPSKTFFKNNLVNY